MATCLGITNVKLIHARAEDFSIALVPMGNVAEDPDTRPRLHFFTGSMASWHTIVDDLPRHEACPAEFVPGAIAVDRPAREPKHRAPSEEAAFAARSHSTTRQCGCTTAAARDVGAP